MATKNIENVVEKIFLKIFSTELKEKPFDFKKAQDKFQNWDSFSHMELVAEIENEFGISLNMDEVISVRSPQDFVNLVTSKRKS